MFVGGGSRTEDRRLWGSVFSAKSLGNVRLNTADRNELRRMAMDHFALQRENRHVQGSSLLNTQQVFRAAFSECCRHPDIGSSSSTQKACLTAQGATPSSLHPNHRPPRRCRTGDGLSSLWVFGGQGAATSRADSSRTHQGVKIRSLTKRTCFNDFFEFDTKKL